MADETPKIPASHADKIRKLEAAFDAYLREIGALKKDRRNLKERYIKRVDTGKIEQIRKLIQSL